jgi:LacI family transcriptional regulator
VADAAGLSKSATSYALRGLRGAEETQARVREIAARLGYTADPIARALAGGGSGVIAIVGSLRDLWQQDLAVMLSRALKANDLASVITDVDASPVEEELVLRALNARQVEGVLALPVDPSAAYWAEVPDSVRVVTLGDSLPSRPDSSAVLFDNTAGVGTALRHLAELGHSSVAVLAPSLPTTPGRPIEVLASSIGRGLGLTVSVSACPASLSGAAEVATRLLRAHPHPTALFCLSDSIAFGAYSAARAVGLSIPDELSILGYDDSEMAALVSPQLSTFAWDEQAIVDAAVAALTAPSGGAITRTTFSPTFVPRESTTAPSRRFASSR